MAMSIVFALCPSGELVTLVVLMIGVVDRSFGPRFENGWLPWRRKEGWSLRQRVDRGWLRIGRGWLDDFAIAVGFPIFEGSIPT